MKKTILFTVGMCVGLAACTSKEQEKEIRAFWRNQFMRLEMSSWKKVGVDSEENRALLEKFSKMQESAAVSKMKENASAGVGKITQKLHISKSASQTIMPAPAQMPSQPVAKTSPKPSSGAIAQKPARKMSAKPQTSVPANSSKQVLEVTLDDDNAFPGKASYNDRVRMKREWHDLQMRNQASLRDIYKTFGAEVYNEALVITTNTEQQLQKTARTAGSFAAYMSQQRLLFSQQEKELQELMQRNAQNIRYVK